MLSGQSADNHRHKAFKSTIDSEGLKKGREDKNERRQQVRKEIKMHDK
jgi:hypothetical protein